MLQDKIILITGASRGIGKTTAELCAKNGAHVIINYNNSETDAKNLVDSLTQRGLHASAVQGDISNEDDVKKIFLLIKNHFGRLDILVNNAGIMLNSPIMLSSCEDFEQTIDVNCRGVFLCTKYVVKMMMKQKSGKIINISSIAGIEGVAGQSIYCGSKAFVIGYTKSIAKELGRYGITANTIAPGIIDTDLTQKLHKSAIEKYVLNNALGRIGTPDDVAKVVLFLSSNLGDYITGQVLRVDGGQVI